MKKSGKLLVLFSLWVIFDRGNGINEMDLLKKSTGNKVEVNQWLRYRRNADCFTSNNENGYLPLTKGNVQVQFFKQGGHYYATATWQKPKVRNSIPISAFAVYWGTIDDLYNRDCKVVENKNTLKITPSDKWSFNEILVIEIVPLPVKNTYQQDLLQFVPKYQEISNRANSSRPTGTSSDANKNTDHQENSSNPRPSGESPDGHKDTSDNNSKIVIGAVSGVAMGIVLIVILIVCYRPCTGGGGADPTPRPSGPYYVSYCPENDESFMTKVVNFISWLRKRGFDVQADCMLSEDNELLLREIGRLRLRDQLLGKAKNVFMIVSPSYLRLCRLDEHAGKSGQDKPMVDSLSLEEKMVYNEIMYIRYDLLSTVSRNDRFIPILFGVDEAKVPFWIKDLLLYTWPDEKEKERLLYRLDNKPEYLPAKSEVAV